MSGNDGKQHTLTMTKLVHRQPKIRKSQHDLYLIILIGKQTMICGKACFADEKDPEKGKDVNRAEYKEYRDVVLNQCKERGDEEARVIKHRSEAIPTS